MNQSEHLTKHNFFFCFQYKAKKNRAMCLIQNLKKNTKTDYIFQLWSDIKYSGRSVLVIKSYYRLYYDTHFSNAIYGIGSNRGAPLSMRRPQIQSNTTIKQL